MPATDPVIAVVREWITKAENDLTTAAHTLKLGKKCPTETVCFHAQQCTEKYLKALLVLNRVDFPRTHQVQILMDLVPPAMRPVLNQVEQIRLSIYAVAVRYPGEDDPATMAEAREAVKLARSVRGHVRKLLPKASLRRKK